jgi:hypothetical protein
MPSRISSTLWRIRTSLDGVSMMVALALVSCTATTGSLKDDPAGEGIESKGESSGQSHDAGTGATPRDAATESAVATSTSSIDGGEPPTSGFDATRAPALDSGAGTRDVATPEVPPPAVDAAPPANSEAGSSDDGAPMPAPAAVYIGRFDMSDPGAPQMAWPGTEIDVRFDGTGVSVQLTQADGYAGGPSWFDVVIDGALGSPFSVSGAHVVVAVASGLAPGTHLLQLQKRTEANLGTVTFEGFTFVGGAGLLAPPPRLPHRIEFLSDSTIDGFGVLTDNSDICPATDPPQYNDSRSSMAWFAASTSNAEMVLSAYSGKGLTVDEDPEDTQYFEDIYPYIIPDDSMTPWSFAAIPDAVVFSVGGVDMDGQATAPPGLQAAYEALVETVRGHYPKAAIWLTVWSQITNEPVATRTAMTGVLQAVIADRQAAGDHNVFLYVFPEATEMDETGCEGHANVAHEQAMGALLASVIQQQLGW